VGAEGSWADLEAKWKERCQGTPFHANECESDQGDFKGRSHADNKALYRDLVALLAASSLTGFGFGFDLEAQRQIMPGALPLAYYRAFGECVDAVLRLCSNVGHEAEITFDMGDERKYNAGLLYEWVRASSANGPRWLPSDKLGFGRWRESPRLQAADLIAFEVMKALDNSRGPVRRPTRKSWEVLGASGKFGCELFSEEWFRGLKADLPNLEARLGIKPDSYARWLKASGRQHSVSNLFHFFGRQWEEGRSG